MGGNLTTNVFLLNSDDGRPLSPAVQATVLAKYSRSAESAKQILSKISEEDAEEFQKKWFVGYSHSSVGELANIAICFEGVSIIASKFLESFQRGAYSEKSTRYQVFSKESFIVPPGCSEVSRKFVERFYDAYDRMMPRMIDICATNMGLNSKDPDVLKKQTVKARAFDNLRYLLPAGTGTNVACVLNGRDVRYMVREALAHSNPEIRNIGGKLLDAMNESCPVFVKDVEPDDFELRTKNLGYLPPNAEDRDWYVELWKPHLLPNPAMAQSSFEAFVADAYEMSWSSFCRHMEKRKKRSVPKIFRTIDMSFDMMMDYGAWRDIQRHRRCEMFAEPLTSNYGYLIPDDIKGTELEHEYKTVMDSVDVFEDDDMTYDSDLCQYIIPIGYLHRSVMKADLEQVYYLCELRTQPQGHISYRRVAYRMYELAKKQYPHLMKWCQAIKPEEIGEHK